MKNINKVLFVILIILILGIGSTFAYSIYANEIGYHPTDEEFEVENVQQGLDELRDTCKPDRLYMEYGYFEMGSRSGYRDFTPVHLEDISKYKKLTLKAKGNIGTYISVRVYIDGTLVETISNLVEHEYILDHNEILELNFYCYNGLSNGAAGIDVTLE